MYILKCTVTDGTYNQELMSCQRRRSRVEQPHGPGCQQNTNSKDCISFKNLAPKKLFLLGFAQYLEVKASAQRQMAK